MVHDANANFDGTPLLAPLSQEERDQLVRQCRFRRFAAGEHIIDGQSDSRDVFFVIEGTVRVVNYSLSGREVALDDIQAGGFFGELAALDGGPRSAFVMAQGGAAVSAAMPFEVFLELLAKKPVLGLEIMKRLARMVRQATERIMDLSTLGANNRVHAELLRQAWSSPNDGRAATITPIPLHADIASRVSTTRETVARVLNDLARSGILERKKNSLLVRDMSRLAMLVEDVRGN
ncbi:Crp/Fnr family transcriptional regulator [Telmatospirillum siberiense]|uniref:Crp/Fnr family transcriptional regulator n=1 Tax=Telmatospirillum siberiense TaxID=382514 RepID=A0A2N3PS07_9PROT|nr:Crp/Fnr family transcriptional regulator [Telmatospirillum siberiense]PKU23175.1 Crp/Fnr family transcriptional regulator [Telmatospirillum siberiense]